MALFDEENRFGNENQPGFLILDCRSIRLEDLDTFVEDLVRSVCLTAAEVVYIPSPASINSTGNCSATPVKQQISQPLRLSAARAETLLDAYSWSKDRLLHELRVNYSGALAAAKLADHPPAAPAFDEGPWEAGKQVNNVKTNDDCSSNILSAGVDARLNSSTGEMKATVCESLLPQSPTSPTAPTALFSPPAVVVAAASSPGQHSRPSDDIIANKTEISISTSPLSVSLPTTASGNGGAASSSNSDPALSTFASNNSESITLAGSSLDIDMDFLSLDDITFDGLGDDPIPTPPAGPDADPCTATATGTSTADTTDTSSSSGATLSPAASMIKAAAGGLLTPLPNPCILSTPHRIAPGKTPSPVSLSGKGTPKSPKGAKSGGKRIELPGSGSASPVSLSPSASFCADDPDDLSLRLPGEKVGGSVGAHGSTESVKKGAAPVFTEKVGGRHIMTVGEEARPGEDGGRLTESKGPPPPPPPFVSEPCPICCEDLNAPVSAASILCGNVPDKEVSKCVSEKDKMGTGM